MMAEDDGLPPDDEPANDTHHGPPPGLVEQWDEAPDTPPPPESRVAERPAPGSGTPPPWSPEAETGVLGYLLLGHADAVQLLEQLRAQHFYSGAHVALYRATASAAADGYAPDVAIVAERLRHAGAWGGPEGWDVPRLIDVQRSGAETPARAATLLRRLDDLARRRAFIAEAIALEARARLGQQPTDELLDAAQTAVATLAASSLATALPVVDAADVPEELPQPHWLCEGMRIAPGAPVMVAGYGYSRKTMAMQALALAVASGRRVFDMWECRRGPVLHIDYEQGGAITSARYVRLARGMGFKLSSIDRGALQFAVLPGLYLDQRGAESKLAKACEGKVLVIVDSLKASTPSSDENASDVRTALDIMLRVSNRTGAAFVVIHHATKPTETRKAGSKESIRGSGALFDACGGVFVFQGEKGEPTKVRHVKERVTGQCLDDFGLDAEDVPCGPDMQWGLRVVRLEPEQLSDRLAGSQRDETAALAIRVLDVIRAQGRVSKRTLRDTMRARASSVDAAIERLVVSGRVRIDGSGPKAAYVVNGNEQ